MEWKGGWIARPQAHNLKVRLNTHLKILIQVPNSRTVSKSYSKVMSSLKPFPERSQEGQEVAIYHGNTLMTMTLLPSRVHSKPFIEKHGTGCHVHGTTSRLVRECQLLMRQISTRGRV